MKNLILLLLPLLAAFCANDSKQTATASENTSVATTDTKDNTHRPSNDIIAYSPLEVVMRASEVEAKQGAQVCVPVTVANFKDIIAMQYSIKWDPNVLTFQSVQGFKLPKLGINNYGANRTSEGLLTFLWLEEMLKGVSLDDGASIFEVCFIAKGQPGQFSTLKFTDKPTAIEIINARDQVLNMKKVAGKVTIK